MFPLKDDNPTHHTPWLTIALIVANVLVYFLWQTRGTQLDVAIRNFQYAAVPYNITQGGDEGEAAIAVFRGQPDHGGARAVQVQYVGTTSANDDPKKFGAEQLTYQAIPAWMTLVTSMFMHGSIMHLLGNMLFLWIFGNNLEDATGKIRFLVFYLLTGFVASFGHIYSDTMSIVPTLGASGAISGILGGYLLLYPKAKVLTLIPLPGFFTTMYLPAIVFLVIWLFTQISGVLDAGAGVAWWAHIGGFLAGLITIKLLESREHRERARAPTYRPQSNDRHRRGF